VAVIAKNPEGFEKFCKKKLTASQYEVVRKIRFIKPEWTYEELLEELAI
jgi:hypothetical protein